MSEPTNTLPADAVHRIHPQLLAMAVPLSTLTPDPKNARLHGERNIEEVMASYRDHGQRKSIVVQRVADDGTPMVVRAGNGQLEAAKRLGWTHIAVLVVDENDRAAIKFALRDNRTAELAEWSWEVVAHEMAAHEKEFGAGTFTEVGFTAAELQPLRHTDWFKDATGQLEDHTRDKPDRGGKNKEQVTIVGEDAKSFTEAMAVMRDRFSEPGMNPGHVIGRLARHYLATINHSSGVNPPAPPSGPTTN
jgi:hypothetical protein